MRIKNLLLAMAVLIIASTLSFAQNETTFHSYKIEFDGVVNNGDGTSTWTYTVTGLDEPQTKDLSHWIIALCEDHVVTEGTEPIETGLDPTTGVDGVKFDQSVETDATETFYFILDAQYDVEPVEVAFKAGPNSFYSTINGPSCDDNPPPYIPGEDPLLVLWLDASDIDDDGLENDNPADGASVPYWDDKTSNKEDASINEPKREPVYRPNGINGYHGVEFVYDYGNYEYGYSDILCSPNTYDPDNGVNHREITTDNADRWYPDPISKSLFVLFKTGTSINEDPDADPPVTPYYSDGRQCIVEFGGPLSGFNVYISNGKLVAGMWNRYQWKFTQLDVDGNIFYPMTTEKVYLVHIQYNGDTKRFRCIANLYDETNNTSVATSSAVLEFDGLTRDFSSELLRDDASGIGGACRTRYHDFSIGETHSDHFGGIIGEVMLYNSNFNDQGQNLQDVYDYINSEYGTNFHYLPANAPKFAYDNWRYFERDENPYQDNSIMASVSPNPFSNSAEFELIMSKKDYVTVELFDSFGNRVDVIYKGEVGTGISTFNIDGGSLPSGMYIYRITGSDFVKSGKAVLYK